MIQITCKGNGASCTRTERLTSGMVGLQCEFVFDSAWDGLAKTAVFQAGSEKRDVLLQGAVCNVPWEVLKTAGYQLVIGVYGTNAEGTLVIPTVYAMCGSIAPGADPSGEESTDPTLPVWGQMQGMIGDLGNLATTSKDNLVAAINEAAQSGGGGASVELDTTLTQSGKAADAAVVGKRISSLSEEIVTTAASQVSAHNTGEDTHSDIRLLIHGLTDRLNALADSDDTTLDQLSEVVAYIKSNRSLIEAITTNKVSVADIIDNLTTNVTNKPLSAAQGVALKALIDAITIPEALPNPNALTFTGAVTGSYDGSAPLKVEIPSGGGGASGDYIPNPTSAQVGQTIVVKAVDENGKPTEWEAADMASGSGSGGGIHLIARVVTEANAASIEVTGLSTTAEVLSLRIYNPGSTCGGGLCITANGLRKVGYSGTIAGTNIVVASVRAWLYRDGNTLYGRSQMTNEGTNVYEWPEMGEITSIAVDSYYNDGTTKYFQTGTIFEIYEGTYPNVN